MSCKPVDGLLQTDTTIIFTNIISFALGDEGCDKTLFKSDLFIVHPHLKVFYTPLAYDTTHCFAKSILKSSKPIYLMTMHDQINLILTRGDRELPQMDG